MSLHSSHFCRVRWWLNTSTDTGILHRNLTVGFICELNLRGLLGSQRRGCRLPRFIQRGGRASLANPENYTLELNAEINQTFNFGLDTDIRIVSFFVPDIKWHTVAVSGAALLSNISP